MDNRYENSPAAGTTTGTAGVGEQVMNKTQDVLQQGKEQAGRVAEQVKDQVKTGISSQKDAAAGQLGAVADALRQTGQNLQGQERGAIGDYAMRAAEVVDGISAAMRSKDIDQMVADVERFARRNPAVFLGSAFALGFMAARFLKSTGHAHYEGRNRYEADTRYSRAHYEEPHGAYTGTGRPLHTAYETANRTDFDDQPLAETASGRVRTDQYPHRSHPMASGAEIEDEFDSEGITTGSRGE